MAPSRIDTPPSETATLPSVEKLNKTESNLKSNLKPARDDIYGNYYPVNPRHAEPGIEFQYRGPMEPSSVGFLQPTSPDTPLKIMHERFERGGYLVIRLQIIPVERYNIKVQISTDFTGAQVK